MSLGCGESLELGEPSGGAFEKLGLDVRVKFPRAVALAVPTVYAKLNFINHCQYLLVLQEAARDRGCEHAAILAKKVEALRRVLAKIVDADSVLNTAGQEPGASSGV